MFRFNAHRLVSLVCAVVVATAAPTVAQSEVDGTSHQTVLYVPSGESTRLAVAGVTRLAVGDAAIAGVVMAGNGDLLINGKSHGHTTLFVWQGRRCTSYLVDVTQQSLDDYARVIRNAINEPGVNVQNAKNAIIASGSVIDTAHFTRVDTILARFLELAHNEKFSVVNAVTIVSPLGSLQKQMRETPGLERVAVDLDGKGNVVVSGTVADRRTAQLALQHAGGLAGVFLSADGKVIDRLVTDKNTQIGVKVYVLEVDDTAQTQLGLRLQGANPDPTNPGNFIYGNPTFLNLENLPKGLTPAPFQRITRLAPTLDLLVQSGHARILSEPNLVTTPGVEAKFLVGGEIPYVFSTGLGQVSIEFKPYGVSLDMTPKILGNGSIDTIVAPEVSDLDYQNGIQLNGYTVPALKTSKLSTELITQPGESIIMGGLLRHVDQRILNKVPLLGDIPVLGKLFRSTQYQRTNTDVVFVMTPEALVR